MQNATAPPCGLMRELILNEASDKSELSKCATSFALQKLRRFFQNVSQQRYGEPFSEQTNIMVWSLSVAIFSVGGMIGSLSVGAMVNKFGRCALLDTAL